MRVALLHDYLNQYGGAERVLEAFCEIFPDAPIYTLFYDEEKTLGRFKGKKIITSFLDLPSRVPPKRSAFNEIVPIRPCCIEDSRPLVGTTSQTLPIAPIQSRVLDRVGTKQSRILDEVGTRNDRKGGIIHNFVINHHRFFIPLMPIAASMMKVDDDYDIVLSSSAGFGKGIRTGKAIHISYCHTPLRYAWEHYKYFNWGKTLKLLSSPAFWYLKTWDKMAGQKTHKLIANSKYISDKIKNYYKKGSEVIYPPVDTEKFFIHSGPKKIREIAVSLLKKYPTSSILQNNFKELRRENINCPEKENYFIAVGRLVHYKKFDLIIQTFNRLGLPLLIIGEGPELNKLKKMARSPKIEFLKFITDEQLNFIYNFAQALVFPQIEDFGLVAAEAQACGTPVIALNQGGGKEIIIDGKTGILFNHQNIEDLIMAIRKIQIRKFDRKLIRKHALQFSKNKFKKDILKAIYNVRDAK